MQVETRRVTILLFAMLCGVRNVRKQCWFQDFYYLANWTNELSKKIELVDMK